MFGLFKKRAPEVHLRQGKEIGECRENAAMTLKRLGELDASFEMIHHQETVQLTFQYHHLALNAPIIGNTFGLELETVVSELNIRKGTTVAEKAFAYRCIDHVSWKVPGVRGYFHPDTGDLILGVRCAGFEEQFRADTLIDIALFMIEDAVFQARTYLNLPATPAEQVRVDQWDGGYHFGEGLRTFPSARDAFAAFMEKHEGCQEVSRDEASILLQSGPVQYEVRGFGWPNGFMVQTATRGFKHVYADDERYVQVRDRLAQDILNPERPSEEGQNYWGRHSSTIVYFQPDGTMVLGQYGFGNPRTEGNRKAFNDIATAHMVDVYYMTYLAEALPEELYSDERNRPN